MAKTWSEVNAPALRDACDRCARESRSIDWVALACLCADCRDDLKTRSLTMFLEDTTRWHRRPLNALRIYEKANAA